MSILKLFAHSGLLWYQRDADQHAAATAYFMLFAFAPLIYFSLAIVGLLTGVDRFRALLLSWGNAVNSDLTELLYTAVINFTNLPGYYQLPIFGLVFLTVMIMVALSSLSVGLHKLWDVQAFGWSAFLKRLLNAFYFIVLLQGYFVLAIWFSDVVDYLGSYNFTFPIKLIELPVMYVATAFLIAMAYRLLSLHAPSLMGRLVGAAVASLLLLFSRELVAFQFTSTPVQSLYGAAGLLLILLIWFYVVASAILFGAALARVYDESSLETT